MEALRRHSAVTATATAWTVRWSRYLEHFRGMAGMARSLASPPRTATPCRTGLFMYTVSGMRVSGVRRGGGGYRVPGPIATPVSLPAC